MVTGSGRGIGAVSRRRYARVATYSIAIFWLGPRSRRAWIGVAADLPIQDAIARVAEESFGGVDIVVNNAAFYPNHPIEDLDFATWRRTMSVNLDAHFLAARQFVPAMRRKKWGRFVGISSNSIGLTIPGMSHYIASKMAVIGFMRGLANDVANDGITCNAQGLDPYRRDRSSRRSARRSVWQAQAIQRFAEPEDIVGPILFLTTDDAAFMTGQALVVDGGQYRVG